MDRISVSTPRNPSEAVIHHIPCSINYDGVAKVSTYFVPERMSSTDDSSSSSSHLTAYFRGRKLDGTSITLPTKVTGLILRESANASSSDKETIGTPDKLTSEKADGEEDEEGGKNPISKSTLAALIAEDDEDEDEDNNDKEGRGRGGGGNSSDGGVEDGGGLWGSGMAMFMDEDDDEDNDGINRDKMAGKKRKIEQDSSNIPSSSTNSSSSSLAAPKREYQIDANFSTLTSWHHDRPGTDHDLVPVALEWIEVARVLHDST
jgi:hypothetical protein